MIITHAQTILAFLLMEQLNVRTFHTPVLKVIRATQAHAVEECTYKSSGDNCTVVSITLMNVRITTFAHKILVCPQEVNLTASSFQSAALLQMLVTNLCVKQTMVSCLLCVTPLGSCVVIPTPPCNDGNACTDDFCNASSGCVFTSRSCSDNNVCTVDSCNSQTGCVYTSLSCDGQQSSSSIYNIDDNTCTVDSCNTTTGCQNTPVSVPQGNMCLGIYCDPKLGITKVPVICPTACSGCNPSSGCRNCPGGAGFNQ